MASKLDYLKKYMSKEEVGEDSPKKKKKRKKGKDVGGFKIIDTDLKTSFGGNDGKENKGGGRKIDEHISDDENQFALTEELPQVAGVIDDRPAEMTGKWKSLVQDQYNTSQLTQRGNAHHESSDSDQAGVSYHTQSEPKSRVRHDSSSDDECRTDSIRRKRKSNPGDLPGDDPHPRRRTRHDSSTSEETPAKGHGRKTDSDSSPRMDSKRNAKTYDSDNSPPRTRKRTNSDSDFSPPRRSFKLGDDSDVSPPRRTENKHETIDSDVSPPRGENARLTKTLDGKKAGLQTASSLKSEMDTIRMKEKKRLLQLSSDVSGKDAQTKVRGRLKEKQEEEARRKAEVEISEKVQEQYAAWGKGLKQIKQNRFQIESDLREMNKSLARTKDDDDMNLHLMEKERAEDPMLAYMQNKRKNDAKGSGANQCPEYKGPPPPPNRFGIKPGYRWDGVDRSTGFEKRLFEHSNKKIAVAEEAYKWSTEDM